MKNRSTVVFTGALAGGLSAVAILALFVGRFATDGLGLTSNGDAELSVTTGALYLATVVAALLGGTAVSVIAYGVSAESDEDVTRFELVHILPFGLVAAVVTAYSILRAGAGLLGDAAGGVISITVAELGFTALLSGLVTGGVIAWVVAILAAKSIVGLEGEAAPANGAAMMRAAMQAVTGPMLAIAVIAALAIALAQLLLAAEGTAAIAIFSGAAGLVLLGAAGAAYLGGPRDSDGAAN